MLHGGGHGKEVIFFDEGEDLLLFGFGEVAPDGGYLGVDVGSVVRG